MIVPLFRYCNRIRLPNSCLSLRLYVNSQFAIDIKCINKFSASRLSDIFSFLFSMNSIVRIILKVSDDA